MNQFENTFLAFLTGIIILITLISNILCFIVYSRKKFTQISTSFFFKAIAITNCLTLAQELRNFVIFALDYNIRLESTISCKVVSYLTYAIIPISPWIMNYISFSHLSSLKYPNKFKFRNAQKSKWLTIGMIIILSFGIYLPVVFVYELFENKETCFFINTNAELIVSYVNLLISTILPFIIMITSSILIISFIMESRNRLNQIVRNRMKKDVHFAITSIIINFVFLACYLPITIYDLFPHFELGFVYYNLNNLMYINCAIQIFLQLSVNVFFRKEFLKIFSYKKINRVTNLVIFKQNTTLTENK